MIQQFQKNEAYTSNSKFALIYTIFNDIYDLAIPRKITYPESLN
jgi:hypothetical protein